MAHEIDMTNHGVRALLGDDGRIAAPATGKKELVQLAGDEDRGLTSTIGLDRNKTEVLIYDPKGDVPLLTFDVYQMPGEPLKVHILCPRCQNHSTISGDRKAIEWDPTDRNPRASDIIGMGISPHMQVIARTGRISIETFECAWELDKHEKVGAKRYAGGNLCRWRAAIDNNMVKRA